MTWTKLSDDYDDDCWTLSSDAYRLHTAGLVWSNRKLLNCRIPKADMHRFRTPEALPELLAEGYWAEDGDAYLIVHHADYQPTKEQVLSRQNANRQNARRGGRPRKPRKPKETDSVSESVSGWESDSVSAEVVEAAPETHSVSEWQSDSETHRDGTGQDSTKKGEHMEPENGDEKETVPLDHDGTCADCGAELPLTADALLSHRCVPRGDYSGGPVEWNSALRSVSV